MALEFSDPHDENTFNAYVDWAWRLKGAAIRGSGGRFLAGDGAPGEGFGEIRPVFVVARDDALSRRQFFAAVDAIDGVRYDPSEADLAASAQPVEAVLYVPAAWFQTGVGPSAGFDALCEVLHVGPVVIRWDREPDLNPLDIVSREAPRVTAGIIDDGIGFLNARFTAGGRTRFDALWIQTLAQEATEKHVRVGHVLSRGTIDDMLASVRTASERDAYRALRGSVPVLQTGLPPGVERPAEQAASHGTFILDLAAGSDPVRGALREVPILGVQLPPESVDDTSGVRLEIHIVQALRWMIETALKTRTQELIVCLSFGVAAGAKDGSRFIEQQMRREVDRAAEAGLPVRIVLPFGNEYRSRLVARLDLDGRTHGEVDLRLQRDDETASFAEIRPVDPGALPPGLELRLIAPGGQQTQWVATAPGEGRDLVLDGTPVGHLYHVAGRTLPEGYAPTSPHLVLALSPTSVPVGTGAPTQGGWLAPPGRWRLQMRETGGAEVGLSLQIQRDDSAFGHRGRGRQALFDDAGAHAQSPLFRDRSGIDEAVSAISHAGTNTAYVSLRHPGVSVVSAARSFQRLKEAAGTLAPAYYASEGSAWSGGEPDVAQVVETSALKPGVNGAGNASGSVVRLSGTSAAAALHARHLIDEALGLGAQTKQVHTLGPDDPDRPRLGGRVLWDRRARNRTRLDGR